MSKFLYLFLCALVFSSLSVGAQVTSVELDDKKKENVTIIKISDSSQIPKGAKIIRFKTEVLQVDSTRFVKKRSIKDERVYPDQIKGITVDKNIYGKHTEYIRDYVISYHRNHGSRLQRMKAQNSRHFSFIDNVMKKNNIPKELKALAVIESAMRFDALSPVGARGPWQFMPETGRLLGLRVDEKIDERVDFYKSTNAAARYLKRINRMFNGDWLLTVAGYNWGPGNITRQINKSQGKSFWDIKDQLPKETRNHVMAFIATASFLDPKSNVLEMGNFPLGTQKAPRANFGAFASAFNDEPTVEDNVIRFQKDQPKIAPHEADNIAILKVKGSYTLSVIAKVLDFELVTLQRWNPKFDTEILNTENAIYLRIPIDKLDAFIMQKETIVRQSRIMMDANK